MTNEQLAIAIKSGDTSLLTALWEQVYKLLYKLATRYYSKHTERCNEYGVTLDDLKQECYSVMLNSIKAYDVSKDYLLTTYFNLNAKNCFNDILGFRTVKKYKDLLSNSISLDEPVEDVEDCTLMDTMEDKEAYKSFEEVEENIYIQALHNDLEKCFDALNLEQVKVIKDRYYNNKTLSDISKEIGKTSSYIRQIEKNSLRKLRAGKCIALLEPYRENIISSAYSCVGLRTFKSSMISVEQRIIEHMEQAENKYKYYNYQKII